MSIRIIGAAIGHGAQDPDSQNAPDFIRSSGIVQHLESVLSRCGIDRFEEISWDTTLYPHFTKKHAKDVPVVTEFCERLQKVVGRVLNEGDFPLIIGGDHSCAVGTWSGISKVCADRGQEKPGLLWIDAHLDSHTFETSPSWALHGMPLACLLGKGHRDLVSCGGFMNKLDPSTTVVYGARSWESGEKELLDHLGVRIYTMDEIRTRGYESTLREAYAKISSKGLFGMTVDLDAFDPMDCPAVGSPEKEGLSADSFIAATENLDLTSTLLALEVVEFAPAHDVDNKTLSFIKRVIPALLKRE